MSIKSQGGVFGRNPTFNDVTVDGDLSIAGTLSVGGETITGLSYQGGWNASTNTPDIAASSPVTGQFWIVSADGSTDVGGITNWTSGDWALYDGSNWQRVEGGNTDLSTGVQGQLAVANGGTGAADAATARTNLGLGTAATTASTDYATAAQGTTADSALQPADIGSTVQGYDADTAKYDDATANFTGTLQNGGSNVVVDSDIGSTVQAYDADTAKYDAATAAFTGNLTVDSNVLYVNASTNKVGLGTSSPSRQVTVQSIGAGDNLPVRIIGGSSTTSCRMEFQDATTSGNYQVTLGSEGDNLRLYAGGGNRLTVESGGDVKVVSGNLVIGTSGNGIDFSATSGTGTSELLDDYEEGNWTPVVTSSSGTLTTVTVTWAKYTKVGNKVFVSAKFVLTDAGTGSGTLSIDGLPYSPASTGSGNAPAQGRIANSGALLHGQFSGGLSRIASLQNYDNTDPITNGYTYVVSGTYFA